MGAASCRKRRRRVAHHSPQIAQDNGVPNYCHFDMSAAADFATGFSAALQNITGQVLSCSYQINDTALNGQVVDPDRLTLYTRSMGSQDYSQQRLVVKASDPGCPDTNGWFIDPSDPSGKTIQLCPATCDTIQKDAGAVMDIRGGCDRSISIN